ncbi:MAG: hypothetical protein M3R17_06015 [Bacteroidota bacterium]|nr:hypothetical protein [Bacteroidota bacterium]
MISIETFLPSQTHWLFAELPAALYAPDVFRLQRSSDTINMQYAATGIAALQDGKVVGRLVLYAETGISIPGKNVVVMGNYECVKDEKISAELINAAENFARMEGYNFILGPMNGTTWDTYRFCTNPEAGTFFSEMIHQSYYPQQWEKAGFTQMADYISTIDKIISCDKKATLELEQKFIANDIRFRSIDLNQYEQELSSLFSLCEKAFAKNFLYTPISWEIFRDKYLAVRPYIVPEMVLIAERADGSPAGFAFNFPDHLCKTEKRMILKTLARDPANDLKGLGDVLGNLSQRYARDHKFNSIIHALIYSGNYSRDLSEQYSSSVFKHYALYSKEV